MIEFPQLRFYEQYLVQAFVLVLVLVLVLVFALALFLGQNIFQQHCFPEHCFLSARVQQLLAEQQTLVVLG